MISREVSGLSSDSEMGFVLPVLLEEGDREFGANFGFAEGDFGGEVDRELQGLSSLVGGFAEFVDVGDAGFGPDAFFKIMFGDFGGGGFDGLEVTLGIEDLLTKGSEFVVRVVFDFGEFGINYF